MGDSEPFERLVNRPLNCLPSGVRSAEPADLTVSNKGGTVVFSIRLPAIELEQIRQAAAKKSQPISTFIREAVAEVLYRDRVRVLDESPTIATRINVLMAPLRPISQRPEPRRCILEAWRLTSAREP